jgi:NhaC family Na+:H+ antiporter
MSLARSAQPLTFGEALLPVVTMAVMFGAGATTLGFSGELLVVTLLCCAAVAGFIAVRHGRTWDDIQESAGDKFKGVLPVILILLAVGALIAAWVMSGTIPYMVYWGVRLVSPEYLVLTAFLATAVMSLFTGTSWGSAGTIGVALMGTAAAIDAPLAATAGAVVSGAYFGDKMSPLSDSTNICAIGARADLYKHIRHMMYTTTPSFVMCIVLYAFASRIAPTGDGSADSARALLTDLDTVFTLNWVALIPAVLVVWGIVKRVPPALAIAMSALVAAVMGVVVQGFSLPDAITALVSGFRMSMIAPTGADASTLSDAFRILVERGGLYSMATTLVIVISAFLLAAGMDVSGALDLLVTRMLASVRSVFGLVAATMAAGGTMIAMTSHGGVTGLVIGGMFQKAYRERGLAPENLSRTLEDSVTITEPLMPWTVSAVYMATTVGVPTIEYLPWAAFCYGGPIFSLTLAALYTRTRFGLLPLDKR